ncbi:hypothetical protein C922_05815, partial [Plasmodium inui San Antonio 1]
MFYEFIYLYLFHDSVQSTAQSYHEEPCHRNVIRNLLSAIIVGDALHTGRKLFSFNATEESQEYPLGKNNKTDKLQLKHIQHVLFPEKVIKRCQIDLLKDIVLPNPKPVNGKSGTLENVITPSRLMEESEWSTLLRSLLGKVSQEVRNGQKELPRYPNRIRHILKSLQGNIFKRRLMKQIKLKEWDKTLLNTDFRIDYILKELETHSPTHMLLVMTMLQELVNIIVGNSLVNKSQLTTSESILLTHKSIQKGQFSHLMILLFHLLNHTPYLESNVSIHEAKYLNKITVDNTWMLLATKYLVLPVETQQNYAYASRDSSANEGNEVGLNTESIQEANLANEVHVKDMFDGKQAADDPEQDSLTGDCNLFRKLGNLEEEKPHRSEMLHGNIIRDGIHAYKIDDFPKSNHRLRERAVNIEDDLFKLCQSIQKDSEDCTNEMSWNVDSTYKAALSPDSGLCNFYRSIRHGPIVKEKRLLLEESAEIGDDQGKDELRPGRDSPRKATVAAGIHFLIINRAVKTNTKGTTKVGTFTHLRNGKNIDIKQKDQFLRKLNSLEKDEVLFTERILPGVACTVRQNAVKTRNMSEEGNSLKSNYGLSKRRLSWKH